MAISMKDIKDRVNSSQNISYLNNVIASNCIFFFLKEEEDKKVKIKILQNFG